MELSALRAGSGMEYLSSDAGLGNPIKGFPDGPALRAGPLFFMPISLHAKSLRAN